MKLKSYFRFCIWFPENHLNLLNHQHFFLLFILNFVNFLGLFPKCPDCLFVCLLSWLYAHQQHKKKKETFRLSPNNSDFTSSTSPLHNTHALLVDLWSDSSAVLIKNSFGGLSPVGQRSKRQSERGAVRCCWRLMDRPDGHCCGSDTDAVPPQRNHRVQRETDGRAAEYAPVRSNTRVQSWLWTK